MIYHIMELIESLSVRHPLCYNTGCKLFIPSTFIEKHLPTPVGCIEHTINGNIYKEKINEDRLYKEWNRLKFLYYCVNLCANKSLQQNEYNYLDSDDFFELCTCFHNAYPPELEDSILIFNSFKDLHNNTYITIPTQTGEFYRKKIQYTIGNNHIDFIVTRKSTGKMENLQIPCPNDFDKYLYISWGISYAKWLMCGNTKHSTLFEIYDGFFNAKLALKSGFIKLK